MIKEKHILSRQYILKFTEENIAKKIFFHYIYICTNARPGSKKNSQLPEMEKPRYYVIKPNLHNIFP